MAFSYNSYSLLKTGKDEFGRTLPLKLTSSVDYKLPLLSYLNIPFCDDLWIRESNKLEVD